MSQCNWQKRLSQGVVGDSGHERGSTGRKRVVFVLKKELLIGKKIVFLHMCLSCPVGEGGTRIRLLTIYLN
jgi:hypothetical protein